MTLRFAGDVDMILPPLNVVAWMIAVGLSGPFGMFLLETLLALLPSRKFRQETGPRPPAIVLIPAHNEETGITATLQRLAPALSPMDRVVVVADNCQDRTAERARAEGARVVERFDAERRGKGFALECGMQAIRKLRETDAELSATEPVIVFLDADCRVTDTTVDQLARAAARLGRPVQGLNLSEAEPAGVQAISSLGFHFKNHVRPAGLAMVGLPCHLMGTGMALPWPIAIEAAFGGSHLAEDMQLGIDLAIRGLPTRFCPTALVTSRLPTGNAAFVQQRTRWEHGHLRTSLQQIPRLLAAFLRRWDPRLLALALDLSSPPFSMLVLAGAAGGSLTVALALLGGDARPALLLGGLGAGVAVAVAAGWWKYCRPAVPGQALAKIPLYVLKKLPIYLAFLRRRGPREWVRTERDAVAPGR